MGKKSRAFKIDHGEPREAHFKILMAIRAIPTGFVCPYGKVAEAAGFPGRARWVGRILRDSPLADGVPWHRVVNSTGRISPRGGDGPSRQRRLLTAEGVEIDSRGRIDLAEYRWTFRPPRKSKSRSTRRSH